jgi:hypothetical protein
MKLLRDPLGRPIKRLYFKTQELGIVVRAQMIQELARSEVLGIGQEPFPETRETLDELRRAGITTWNRFERVAIVGTNVSSARPQGFLPSVRDFVEGRPSQT